jgi:spermidine synthase
MKKGEKYSMSEFTLLVIILIEGFVTISAEILTIRQLLPVVGNSVVVTSLIIGVFLLFLAYGYRRGGQYKGGYISILKRNFTISAILLGVGLSYAFIDVFFYLFQRYVTSELLFALSAYLLLVTAPLVYVLGQTVPMTMNLIKSAKTIGEIGGKILHLSTVGSFLGAVLTSVLLMNYFGVAWTVVCNVVLLMLITFLLLSIKQADLIRGISLCSILVIVYGLNVEIEKHFFLKTNAYADYQVVNNNGNKILMANRSLSSLLTPENKSFSYIEFIKRVIFQDLKLRNKDILVLGAGGFTLSANGSYDNHFTYVDIDKDIKGVVNKNFLSKIQGDFVDADARAFLYANQKKYDVIVSDAYSNQRTTPAHLLTQEYMNAIKQSLKPAGIAILNIIATPTLSDDYSEHVDNTIRSVFHHCMAMPANYTNHMNNIIYVCKNNAQALTGKHRTYTDNLNRATLDYFKTLNKEAVK